MSASIFGKVVLEQPDRSVLTKDKQSCIVAQVTLPVTLANGAIARIKTALWARIDSDAREQGRDEIIVTGSLPGGQRAQVVFGMQEKAEATAHIEKAFDSWLIRDIAYEGAFNALFMPKGKGKTIERKRLAWSPTAEPVKVAKGSTNGNGQLVTKGKGRLLHASVENAAAAQNATAG